MDILKNKKTLIAYALAGLFSTTSQAVTVYQNDNGDTVSLYGEVGVGGHIGADYEYGEFYEDKSYIDDSFATLGVKGQKDKMHFRLEVDYERENWKYASGDMVMTLDKLFLGYELGQFGYVEAGLTDTAFDDYDRWGDYTFDTTVETGEAGDQDATIKYEGHFNHIKVGASYSYGAESSSGAELGDVVNAYVGYFGDGFSTVLGFEGRGGSNGTSKYGEQKLIGLGMRFDVTNRLSLGFNGFIEQEDLAQDKTNIDITDPDNIITMYNDYQTVEHYGALVSAKYKINKQWDITGSANIEGYEHWDEESPYWDGKINSWGKERTWGTVGVNYRPTSSTVIAFEANAGDAAQDAYAYARLYF
ncbi:hypothetical protein C9J41_17175 [Photobacterium sp. GB-50]|uniref:TonB-dependent receptor n=1 Tax=Photobacterium sp. GB-50 TaxID=2022107 RepID=UPI000D17CB5B|nr:TonB-dependent receptor [Photobacterium sp. GB-50]PSW72340.1 hypothetical protein C9J41_17175 [Photobacterium sp. GB-50]